MEKIIDKGEYTLELTTDREPEFEICISAEIKYDDMRKFEDVIEIPHNDWNICHTIDYIEIWFDDADSRRYKVKIK